MGAYKIPQMKNDALHGQAKQGLPERIIKGMKKRGHFLFSFFSFRVGKHGEEQYELWEFFPLLCLRFIRNSKIYTVPQLF